MAKLHMGRAKDKGAIKISPGHPIKQAKAAGALGISSTKRRSKMKNAANRKGPKIIEI